MSKSVAMDMIRQEHQNHLSMDRQKYYHGFINILMKNDIFHCVTNSDINFNEEIEDLDIVITKGDKNYVLELLYSYLKTQDNIIGFCPFNTAPGHILVLAILQDYCCLKFDIIWELYWKSMPFLQKISLERQIIRERTVIKPKPQFEFYFLIIKEIIKHKAVRLKSKYQVRLQKLYQKIRLNPTADDHCFLDEKIIQQSKYLIDNINRLSCIDIYQLRRKIIISVLLLRLKNPFLVLWQLVNPHYWLLTIINRYRRNGIFIAIYGPDGSGKSTIISKLCPFIVNSHIFSNYKLFHFRPSNHPTIGSILTNGKGVVSDGRPYIKSPRNVFLSFLKLLYYVLDYNINFYRNVRPLLSKSRAIIFDRYFLDLYLDPERCRMKLNNSITRFFSNFVPIPDFNVFLCGDAAIYASRKEELTAIEIGNLMMRYRNAAGINDIIVDSSILSPNDAAGLILGKICAFLIKKYNK